MFNFNFNWDWSNWNLDALAEPTPVLDDNWIAQVEREIAALSTVVTEAVVNSPAVIEAPVNTAPNIDAVEQAVQQVVQAIAPVVAPSLPDYILQLSTPLFVDEIAYSPEVLAAPVGQTVPPQAIETIVNSIVDTVVKDETFVNSVVASIPQSVINMLPEEDRQVIAETVSQAIETVAQAPDAPSVFDTYASFRQKEIADEYGIQTELPAEITRGEILPKQETTTATTSTPETKFGSVDTVPLTPPVGGGSTGTTPITPPGGGGTTETIPLTSPGGGGTPTPTPTPTITSPSTVAAGESGTIGATSIATQTAAQAAAPAPTTTTTPTTTLRVTPTATSTATATPTGVFSGEGYQNEYKTDLLLLDGKPFTGNRNGIEYKDGLPTTASRADVLEANRNAAEKAEAAARAKSNPLYDFTNRPTAQEPDDNYVYYYSWIGGETSGEWRLYQAPNTPENLAKYLGRSVGGPTQATSGGSPNALINQPTVTPEGVITNPGTGNTPAGPGTGGIPTVTVPTTTAPTTVTTTVTAPVTTTTTATSPVTTTTTAVAPVTTPTTTLPVPVSPITPAATTTPVVSQERLNIVTVLQDRLAKYGLSSLASSIYNLAVNGASEDTIMIQLQETPEYQMRFKANQERIKKGLAVLSPAEYIAVEDGYRQVLRAYGLNQFDSDAYVNQFIANDMSPTELSNRVVTAVQRVQNADPAISKTLRDYYGISNTDLIAYVLDPNQQFQKIQRQVAAAEIGTAARIQGLETGPAVAEQLAAQGISQAEAQKGYATIADILPTAEKLSQIYGGTEQAYGQAEAEQEVFNSLASAQRKRQRLTGREAAQFSGTSGVSRPGLTSPTKGQF